MNKRTLAVAAIVAAAALSLTACAPASPEERVRSALEGFIASAESNTPDRLCADANVTSGIASDATIVAIASLGETDGGELWEADLSEGYVQVVVPDEGEACVVSAVPWSG